MRTLLILALLFSALSIEAEQLKVKVSSKSALLINAETGAILYEKDPTLLCHPASITKIATALYALEKKGSCLDQMIKASQEAAGVISPQAKRLGGDKHPPYRLTSDGTHMSIQIGEILSLRTLLHGLLICSGNDAANVIAEFVSGSIPKFMDELHAFLKSKGCTQTYFANPSGLPNPKQLTTAKDMAIMTREAMKHPLFREIVLKVQHPRPETNKQAASTLFQHNKLLRRGTHYYPKAIGVKTGSIDAASNLVAAAKDGDRTLIAVLLYAANGNERFRDAIHLFEAAFNETLMTRTLLTKDHERFSLAVKGGKEKVEASLADNVTIEFYPSEEPKLKAHLHWEKLSLPITQGQKVGQIHLTTESGHLFKAVPIFAKKDVEMTFMASIGNVVDNVKDGLKQKRSFVLLGLGATLIGFAILLIKKKK